MKNKNLGIITIVTYFIFTFFLVYLPIDMFNLNISKFTPLEKTFYLLAGDLLLILILFIINRKDYRKDLIDFKKNRREYMDLAFKYWLVGIVVMGTSNFIIQTFITDGSIAENEEIIRDLLKALPVYMLFSTGLFAPLIEETVFRKGIKDIMGFNMKFVFVSGIVFGSLHVLGSMTSFIDLAYIIPYSSVGIAFAYLYYKTKNIFSSIAMHMIHNTAFVILELIVLFV